MDEQRIKDLVEAFEAEINYDPDVEYISISRVEQFISDLKGEFK